MQDELKAELKSRNYHLLRIPQKALVH